MLALAACGQGSTSGPGAGATATPGTQLATATATVKGKSVTILTTSAGRTLYYLASDSASDSTCTGACTATWPPLIFAGGKLDSASPLSGQLLVIDDANGAQVTYNGHPLYTFSGDAKPGDTNGEGIQNVWHVIMPDTPAQTPVPTGY
jgi:predicted lipoprotein with Yx(FWY)xxD motif